MNTERTALRAVLRQRRRAIPPAQRVAAAESLAAQLLSLPFAPKQGFVAGYWAMDGEIALHAWQLRLPPEIRYCLPVLHADRRLRFAPWRSGEPLTTNRYGIPEPDVSPETLLEPESIHLVVVPLVGFDRAGQRLGMGAGWYDRSFAFRQSSAPPPYLVGAGFQAQQVDALAGEPWDVAVDAVCTEADTHFTPAGSTTSGPVPA